MGKGIFVFVVYGKVILLNFFWWSIINGWGRPGLEIDRIDNNGNYEPGNCRCETSKENSSNKLNSSKHGTGVYKINSGNFVTQIRIKGKLFHLGVFTTPQKARQAYQNKLKEITQNE